MVFVNEKTRSAVTSSLVSNVRASCTKCVLTVAAFTAESFLKACCPVHAGLGARRRDLVGVGFGAGKGKGEKAELSQF